MSAQESEGCSGEKPSTREQGQRRKRARHRNRPAGNGLRKRPSLSPRRFGCGRLWLKEVESRIEYLLIILPNKWGPG